MIDYLMWRDGRRPGLRLTFAQLAYYLTDLGVISQRAS